jgi:hypothetical protein
MQARMRRVLALIAGVVILVVLFLVSDSFVAYRDWAFICENTGSRMGYRAWFFGLHTSHWYHASEVETFIEHQFPKELVHRWTSYAGTGRNIYGAKLLFGHGRPGPIYQVREQDLNKWFTTLSPAEKKAFYNLLVHDDREAVKDKVNEIYEDLFKSPE